MNDATPQLPLVMVVEDELLIATTLEMALQTRGYRVLGPVATVDGALGMLAMSRPDMALIDYRLASTTTEALLQPLHDLRIPICVLTGYTRQQLPAGYASCAMLEKPFRMKELVETLARLNAVI